MFSASVRHSTKSLVLCLSVLGVLASGCGKKEDSDDSKNKVNVLTSSETALVEAGERLIDPINFPIADQLFDAALTANPGNMKARFYKLLLKPMMNYKGMLNRVRPWFKDNGKEAELDRFIRTNQWLTRAKSPLRDFLLAPAGAPIKAAVDYQTFLLDQQKALNEMRVFTKQNRDANITLGMYTWLWAGKISERYNDSTFCKPVREGNDYYMNCPENLFEVQLGTPDLMAIQQYYAGVTLFMNFYTSYSIEGIEQVDKILSNKSLSTIEKANRVRGVKGFATYRQDSQLTLIEELGVDFAAASRWVIANQSSFCPGGKSQGIRKGYMLENGLCVLDPKKEEDSLQLMEKFLAGPQVVEWDNANGVKEKATVNYSVLWKSPIQDLKAHIPLEFNECGKGVRFADNTLGGILPDGDLERFIDKKCP